jgi:hypothetical protein
MAKKKDKWLTVAPLHYNSAIFVGLCHPQISYGQTGTAVIWPDIGRAVFSPHDTSGAEVESFETAADCVYTTGGPEV